MSEENDIQKYYLQFDPNFCDPEDYIVMDSDNMTDYSDFDKELGNIVFDIDQSERTSGEYHICPTSNK